MKHILAAVCRVSKQRKVSEAAKHQRRVVHFRGRVQGVGFRATTEHIAHGYAVKGYVSNLPDGRVLLVAEGESSELDAFLQAIRGRFGKYIVAETCDLQPVTGEFTEFETR